MGRPLPKCDIARDSRAILWYKGPVGSGPRSDCRWLGVLVGIRKQLTDTRHRADTQGGVSGGSRYRFSAGKDVKGIEEDMAKPKKIAAKAKEFAFEKGDFVVYPTHGV